MLKIIRFILHSVLVSECLEEGDWSPVEGRCPTQLDLMASSAWAVITISVLVVVILLLLSCLLWLQADCCTPICSDWLIHILRHLIGLGSRYFSFMPLRDSSRQPKTPTYSILGALRQNVSYLYISVVWSCVSWKKEIYYETPRTWSVTVWLQGYERLVHLLGEKKPSLTSQGVSTRNIPSQEILQFRASLKLPRTTTAAITVPSTTSPLSSFYTKWESLILCVGTLYLCCPSSGSVIGVRSPQAQQPLQDSNTSSGSSSERSSGDGEESLYATIRSARVITETLL